MGASTFASVEPIWNRDCDVDYKELMIFPLMAVHKEMFDGFECSGKIQKASV